MRLALGFMLVACSSGGASAPSDRAGMDAGLGDAGGERLDSMVDGMGPQGTGRDAAAAPDASTADAAVQDMGPDAGMDTGDAAVPDCDPKIGRTAPLSVCSPAAPCAHPLPSYMVDELLEASPAVTACDTGTFGTQRGRPTYGGDTIRSLQDADGITRYYCEFRPPDTSDANPKPLVLYAHPSGEDARNVYDATLLRGKAQSFDLSAGATNGFILVAVQGRHLHWPTADDQDGSKFDTFHRDLSPDSQNRDVALYDAIIDGLVAEGVVDPKRIYTMGWSNGARFSAMYSIGRFATPTAAGNRVAAVANYSGGDPYENTEPSQTPSCKLNPYPRASLPFMLVSRVCDLIACDAAQAASIGVETPGNVAGEWIDVLETQIGATPVEWVIIGDNARARSDCALSCTFSRAALNHARWPDGIQDGSDTDLEGDLLGFLRDHPLP